MKKVRIISASFRPDSNSHALCEEVARGARENGNEVEVIRLRGKKLGYCTGCYACQKLHRCVQQDDANEICRKICEADAVVFGTPVYYFTLAAHISRKTYSAIISNELRPVSKQVAVAFAFALKLSLDEAKELLRSAGHAFSDFMLEDIIYQACLIAGIYDINRVNQILVAHAAKPLPCQDESLKCLHEGDIF